MQTNSTTKTNAGNWEYLLYYDMAVMSNTERELQKHLPVWIHETSSTQLSIILRKTMIFAAHHSLALEQLLMGKRISITGEQRNIVKLLSGFLREKLKYCNSRSETDHCIRTNIISINKLKHCYYQQLLQIATELKEEETTQFFSKAAANEMRVSQWITEYSHQRNQVDSNYYLML